LNAAGSVDRQAVVVSHLSPAQLVEILSSQGVISMTATAAAPAPTSQDVWDHRFLSMAKFVSEWSKDTSTKVGAVIVTPENVVASIGYNGFAQAMPDHEHHYTNREEKYSRIVHGETNAIVLARKDVRGHTIYVTHPPCDRCAVTIIQAGITRVVCPQLSAGDLEKRWKEVLEKARQYFDESGVQFDKVKMG
jgi:dCMP deaminase